MNDKVCIKKGLQSFPDQFNCLAEPFPKLLMNAKIEKKTRN